MCLVPRTRRKHVTTQATSTVRTCYLSGCRLTVLTPPAFLSVQRTACKQVPSPCSLALFSFFLVRSFLGPTAAPCHRPLQCGTFFLGDSAAHVSCAAGHLWPRTTVSGVIIHRGQVVPDQWIRTPRALERWRVRRVTRWLLEACSGPSLLKV